MIQEHEIVENLYDDGEEIWENWGASLRLN